MFWKRCANAEASNDAAEREPRTNHGEGTVAEVGVRTMKSKALR
jgi:hypothetical protein